MVDSGNNQERAWMSCRPFISRDFQPSRWFSRRALVSTICIDPAASSSS